MLRPAALVARQIMTRVMMLRVGRRARMPPQERLATLMNDAPRPLSTEIVRLSNELTLLEQRLHSEPPPDLVLLNQLRQSVDNFRLTAWTVSELAHAHQSKAQAHKVLAFLTAERLRRLNQLIQSLCGDIDRQAVTFENYGMRSLLSSVSALYERLIRCARKEEVPVPDAPVRHSARP